MYKRLTSNEIYDKVDEILTQVREKMSRHVLTFTYSTVETLADSGAQSARPHILFKTLTLP